MRKVWRTSKPALFITVFFCILASIFGTSGTSHAANPSDFNPGRIIDDGIFTNKASMGWEQIQRFLNGKGVYCQNSQAPCIKNYVEGGKTAAQILYDAGQEYSINPQVLIVLLQKEVGLITATSPQNWQYRTATGFACPDSTPGVCDSSYFGFTNQVRAAARMFNKIMTNAPGWYTPYIVGTNSILWHPNAGCGRSTVIIQNKATAALYNYTPYRPNQAALNAGYGMGDGCSSYGNRNFFLYFTDWFGTSYRGPLWRTVESGDLYYVDDGKKFSVPSMDIVAQFGMSVRDVSFVSQSELNAAPLAPAPFNSDLGYVIKSPSDPALYIVSNGYKIPIRTMDQFNQFGFTSADIKTLPSSTIANLILSDRNLSNFIRTWDGSVYKIENNSRRAVFELGIVSDGYTSLLPDAIVGRFALGKAYLSTENYVVYGPDSGVRLYTPTGYHEVASMGVFSCWNMESLMSIKVQSYEIVPQVKKQTLPSCTIKEENQSEWYLLNKGTKIKLGSSQSISGVSTDSILLSGAQTITPGPVVKSYQQNELSVLSTNQKRAIPSLKIFSDLGYSSQSITNLNDAAYNSLEYGPKALSNGSLLLEPNGGVSIVTSPNTRLQITSAEQFNKFGFSWAALIRASQTDLSAFISQGNLPYYIKTETGEVYLVDDHVRYLIPLALDSALALNRDHIPVVPRAAFFHSTLPWNLTRFIKSTDDRAVYMLENGTKRPLAGWDTFMRESTGDILDLVILSPDAVARFPTGSIKN